MAQERLSMRKIREVLRLRWDQGLSYQLVGQSCGISKSCAETYVKRAKAAGLTWPVPEELDDEQLEEMLFKRGATLGESKATPDWKEVHQEMRDKKMTLILQWHEYKERHPDGYQYSHFCRMYRAWQKTLDPVMRQEYKAGEKLLVDYAGSTTPVVNRKTGEVHEAQIFVAASGASNYTYAEATWTQTLPDWIGSHTRAFAFMGGVHELVILDNLPTGVRSAHRYEPGLNRTYEDMANYYGTALLPARVKKPRDKAKVEAAVQGVERSILARLRHRTFFNLAELNTAIQELLVDYNEKPFQKLEGSRKSLFDELERPVLKPLPSSPYEYAEWKKAKVHIDYHIQVDKHFYSVPYALIGQTVEVCLTARTVEILHKGKRVASHARSSHPGRHTTLNQHMPQSHQGYLEWTPDRLLRWAEKSGPSTTQLVDHILASKAHPQQGFRVCLGIIRLGRLYGHDRLENACARALHIHAFSYRSVESILKNGLDQHPLPNNHPDPTPVSHENVRGPDYYRIGTQEGGSCHASTSHPRQAS